MTGVDGTAHCRLCGAQGERRGEVTGKMSGRTFELRRCPACGFVFVANPWLDFEQIYDERYYAGEGADPFVDYLHEADHPGTTIRRHEWRGIRERVNDLVTVGPSTRWLDYGCGTGGLVRYLHEGGVSASWGFEQGWAACRLRERGVPLLSAEELDSAAGTFDVVTAIEVIEHTVDPVGELSRMARLVRPGGVVFLTTGNPEPFEDRLASWRYVVPEVHISFFAPDTLAFAMERAGLVPERPGHGPGWDAIIRYRLLRALGLHDSTPLERLVPWRLAARVVDRRLHMSAQPVGWAPAA